MKASFIYSYHKLKVMASLTIIGTFVALAIWLAVKNSRDFENTVIEQTQNNLLTIAEAQSYHLEEIFSFIERDLNRLAKTPILHKQIVNFGKIDKTPEGDYNPLKIAFDHSKNTLGSIYQLDNKGIVQSRFPFKEASIGEDFSKKPGVEHIIKQIEKAPLSENSRKTYISRIFTADSGRKVISICKPIFSKSSFIGILRSLVYLDTFGEMIKHISLESSKYTWLVNSQGQIISHPDPELIGKSILEIKDEKGEGEEEENEHRVINEVLSGSMGADIFTFDELSEEQVLIAWSPSYIGEQFWIILAQIDFEEIAIPLQKHAQKMYISSALIILTFLTLGLLLYQNSRDKTRLSLQAKSAAEASRLKSQFLANISHEIRTPLNAIIGYSELIRENEDPDNIRSQGKTVLQQAELLLSLINDLLDNAKIEAGKIELEKIPIYLPELTDNIASTFNMLARSKGIDFKLSLEKDISDYVIGDPLRLHQVLANLVSNAVKFTENGFVELKIALMSKQKDVQQIKFSVTDSGIGISKDKQTHVFNSFAQADESTTREFGGTGLGTTIAQQLTRLMGGEITLASELGKGSTFSFVLDMATCTPPKTRDEVFYNKAQPNLADEHKRGCILVAEDFQANQEVIRAHLEKGGHTVMIVDNGKKAVEASKKHRFDIIIMDVQMPEMDGLDATRLIRGGDSLNCHIPIIALTANVDSHTRETCHKSGMNAVLAKPIRRKSLLIAIDEWLHKISEEAKHDQDEGHFTVEKDIPFDYEVLLEELEDINFIEKLLSDFIRHLKEDLQAMQGAIDSNDYENLRKLAHSIKGGAGHLAAYPLASIAAQLEELVKENKREAVPAAFAELKVEVDRLKLYLSTVDSLNLSF